ncbi:hypothetical protein JCGZ_00152 [Jatropha curcas]|uniref:Aminotransferase-like plant mobile domain-containing protein n=1 Tax=Jatropha curcas TaxID=180498 RepID=A0A067JLW8_JATCU|nr:hypothetical protein JCGZ_00152 [Jatropha curcas]
MASPSHSSDEDFLASLGISLEDANDSRIKLDVRESSVAEIPIEIFDHQNQVGAIIGPSYLGYLRHLDMGRSSHRELLCALAERWWDTTNTFHFSWGELIMTPADFSVISGMPFGIRPIELYDDWRTELSSDRIMELIGIDLPRVVEPGSVTPALSGPSRAWPSRSTGPYRAPRAISEATGTLHPDLANLRLPYSIPYYLPDSPLAYREVSLESVDRPTLPSEDITEVPVGLVNQMMELVLGMQQELTTA